MLIDTNVLVYATRSASVHHSASRAALLKAQRSREPLTITRQILREYLAVVTRPQGGTVPFTMNKALARTRLFESAMTVLEDGPHVWREFLSVGQAFVFAGRQIHDANIVATMLTYGEQRILTFNGRDFARFQPMIQVLCP